MNDAPTSASERQVDEVIAAFLEAERAGQSPCPDDLLVQHADLAEELRSFFADRACFARLAGPPTARGQTTIAKEGAASLSTIDAGRYIGLQPHAQGGLGEVFTAIDTELHRVVALKRLQGCLANHAPSKRYFLLEAEVTARLDHPGVVPVHSLFRDDGDRPCYAMRFIEGQTLDEALRAYHAGPPDPVGFRRLLRCFIQVCETIAYAHSRGVLHRDLKPKNIMLGKFGETVVVDWGLAKVVGRTGEARSTNPEATLRPVGDSSPERTQLGAAVGTPAYMSPEQAAGRWDVIDHRTDVYGLGAMLYTVLTGKAPLDSSNWPELQQKIQRGDFPRPRAVRPSAPPALEAVCLKAMALKPEGRYPSARALADEVELWLADEAVQAYQEPAGEQLRRWARRRKSLVASGITAFAIAILVVSIWVIREIVNEQRLRELIANAHYQEQLRHDKAFRDQANRHDQFDLIARATLDQMTALMCQDPRLNGPDFQPLRNVMLQNALTFSDEAIRISEAKTTLATDDDKAENSEPTRKWRANIYRRQRALCLARFGEHEKAFAAAEELGDADKQPSGEAAYLLARIYGLCAAAAEPNQELATRYAGRAMEFLEKARDAGHFEEVASTTHLKSNLDLASLRPREDFRKLLQEVEAKPKRSP